MEGSDTEIAEAESSPARKPRGSRADQRRKSRSALIDAARDFCSRGTFVACSIGDIVQQAGLSRAAFYLHFQSKEALLQAVLDDQADWFFRQNDAVTPDQLSTRQGIVSWLTAVVEGYRQTGDLMQHFWIGSHVQDAFVQHHAYRVKAIEALGRRLPRLHMFQPDGSIDKVRYHRVLLFMYEMEQACVHLAFDAASEDGDLLIDVLAQNFESLLRDS